MARNICETLLDVLAEAGVKHVFGVVGDAINPLVDGIRRDKRFQWVHVRHEEVGAFAASAQAKLTGNLAVCAGTVGPGAIHLLNGLYDAKKDGAPVLAITGQVPRDELGSDYHQEVNLDALFNDVAVYSETITSPGQMPRIAQQAVQTALSRRGVAHVTIPSDLAAVAVEGGAKHPIFQLDAEITPCEADLDRAAKLLDAAPKVAILAGCGCRGARDELLALAAKLHAPIIHALRGKDIVPFDHPHWIGGLGLLGTKGGVYAVDHCDALLMVGTDFPYRAWYPTKSKVIQIDVAAAQLGKRCPLDLGLVGHARSTLAALAPRVKAKSDASFLEAAQKHRARWEAAMDKDAALDGAKAPLRPQAVARAISDLADDDAIFTVDTGEVSVWGARHIHIRGDRRYLMSFNLASMAFAMPGAIGVQLLHPDRQVVSLSGDGGFSMLLGDLLTAVTYELPIKIVVFNNGKLGLVKMEMEVSGYPEYGTDLKNPDFAAVAKACGAGGVRVTDPKDLHAALQEAFSAKGPFVVDAVVDGNELTMPPKIAPAQAWGYSLSKLKELAISLSEKL